MEVGFRRLTLDDLPLFRGWLRDPEVQEWFKDDEDELTVEAVEAKYGPRIRGEVPEEQWLVLVDGVEVAWIQTCAVADFPEYADACASVGFDRAGGTIDYLVSAGNRDRGLGPQLLRAFTEEVAFGTHPAWPSVCSGPEPANVRSWRALEKAGFRFLGEIQTEEGPERLMARDR